MTDHLALNSQAQSQSKLPESVQEDEFITDLLKRQDSVLERLDELNSRIENAILEIGKAREKSSDSPSEGSEAISTEAQLPISKAA